MPPSLKAFSLTLSPPVASFCHLCPHPLLSPPSIPVTFQSPLLPCCFQPSSPVLSASPPLPIGLLAKLRLSLRLPSRCASSQLPPRPPVSLPVTWPTYHSSFSSFFLFYRQLIISVCPDIPEEDIHTKKHTPVSLCNQRWPVHSKRRWSSLTSQLYQMVWMLQVQR